MPPCPPQRRAARTACMAPWDLHRHSHRPPTPAPRTHGCHRHNGPRSLTGAQTRARAGAAGGAAREGLSAELSSRASARGGRTPITGGRDNRWTPGTGSWELPPRPSARRQCQRRTPLPRPQHRLPKGRLSERGTNNSSLVERLLLFLWQLFFPSCCNF